MNTENKDIIELILKKGADIAAVDARGKTPLVIAFEKNSDVVELMLTQYYRGNVDLIADKGGLSHFHITCTSSNMYVVDKFVGAGVDINFAVSNDALNFPGYTDTDSLFYEIRGENMYELMKADLNEFDPSDYPTDNQFNIPLVNKKKVGLMKDEANGKIITEFVGLRSKIYSVRIQDSNTIKKAKGVKTTVVKSTIKFEDYLSCLRNNTTKTCEQNNIRSRIHVLRTEKQKKIGLSPNDNKRCLLPNETDTLPWGHCN